METFYINIHMWPIIHKNHIVNKEKKKKKRSSLCFFKYKRKNVARSYVTSKTIVSYRRKQKNLTENL